MSPDEINVLAGEGTQGFQLRFGGQVTLGLIIDRLPAN